MSETRERWQRAKAIFQAALECEDADRTAFVGNACGDDESLAARVAALLAADAETSTPLESPVDTLAARLLHDRDPDPIGQRLDRYRLLREIGHGGMGTVYLAQRDDGAYEAHVAVKVLQQGMVHESLVRRFHQERQILARLEHPNIARLLDGGVTDDGRPYLVMEHVEGRPFDRYCDEERLGIAQRVDLFRLVCQAVHAAHRNLVVHCDLKPSNILVTAEGVPKLLDFGIARLLDPEQDGRPAAHTVSSGLMTPEYASPEQIRGEGLTTASDVYGLGVVLYRLLTGDGPYRVEAETRHALEQAVLTQIPVAPSKRISRLDAERPAHAIEIIGRARASTPARLRKRLAGDLDTIVLEALEKDAAQRYGSAEELAEDLRRHRVGLPVLARRPSLGYRSGKFLRRHWLGAAAVGLIVLSMAVGTIATARQAQLAHQREAETAEQAQLARQREKQADEFLRFIVELFESTHPDNARVRTLIEILGEADAKMERTFTDQPLARAQLMDTLGEVYRQLAQHTLAEPMLEGALALRRASLPADHPDVAASLDELGALRIEQRRYDEATTLLTDAHAIRLGLFAPDHLDIALSEHRLGQLARRQRDFETAREHFARSLAVRRHHLGRHPKVAESLNNLGVTLVNLEQFEEAQEAYDEALSLRRELLGERHWRTGNTYNNLGVLLRSRGLYADAVAVLGKALDILREKLGEHPKVAAALSNQAVAMEQLARFDEAESRLVEAQRIMEATDSTGASGYTIIQSHLERIRQKRAAAL